MSEYLLQVKDLHTSFFTDSGEVKAVNGVSFNLEAGKTLGIVGESGSGKSVTAYSIMQILADTGKIVSGEVLYKGEDITKWNKKQMQGFRGKKCSIIFQDPMTSLNPVFTIGNQLMEAILLHTDRNKEQARERAIEMLTLVGVNEPEKRLKQYPHELSGGMRQRVMIAMALACEPDILIADEPTTALDVTIQAQILHLMRELKEYFISEIGKMENTVIHGVADEGSAPHIISLGVAGVRSEVLLHTLEDKGIYVSAGSACSAHKPQPSATLKAIGIDKSLLDSTIRFSFSVFTTEEEIDVCLQALYNIVPMLRRYSRR